MWTTQEIRSWATSMRWFRLTQAFGGHANDGDLVSVALRYWSRDDLFELLSVFGIEPIVHQNQPPQPVAGTSYSSEEYGAFASLISDFSWVEQPGHRVVDGIAVFLWCDRGICELSVDSDVANGYGVDAATIAGAIQLEPTIESVADRVIDPPHDTDRCYCPKYHPELWAANEE